MAAADRSSQVVSVPAVRSQDSVAAHVRQVAQEHADVGGEGYWQGMAELGPKWEILCRNQGLASTMTMMAKCGEMVRGFAAPRSSTRGRALAMPSRFRQFMGEATGKDEG